MKTFIVKVKVVQYFEQRVDAETPEQAQLLATNATSLSGESPTPIRTEFECLVSPVELAYE